ncbi:MAG: GNAT family N-acetyltransferase [Roseiarcus sp.]
MSPRPTAQWLAAIAEWQGQTPEQSAIYRRVVRSIAIPAGFARLGDAGEWAALAYGAVHDGLLCCESVVTNPARRRRGHGRRMLAALIAWGAEREARGVCLQVADANAAAVALYRGLGLKTELYRYHYRREPASE